MLKNITVQDNLTLKFQFSYRQHSVLQQNHNYDQQFKDINTVRI